MIISGAGYVGVRLLGPRFGLPIAGIASGFVAGIATIAAMGSRAAKEPLLLGPALSEAVLSNVSTAVLVLVLVGATDGEVVRLRAPPLAASALTVAVTALCSHAECRWNATSRLRPVGRST
jgi:uncharacterized membrane protein (DUF4010 family)